MKFRGRDMSTLWTSVGTKFLPFADAASDDLPLPRLLRLSLFQVSVGMVMVLLTGTLNRVMIVELSTPAWIVAVMVSLPLVFAPFRTLIGHKSDTHRSVLGWRRGPYIWFGSVLQFAGLAIMPFALLVLSGAAGGLEWFGQVCAGLAFLLVGAGMHTTQTAGLALATDIAPEEDRPRVVALLYVMLLVGMTGAAIIYGLILADYSSQRLVQLVQGSAVVAVVLNMIALWKQEARDPALTAADRERESFGAAWGAFIRTPKARRLLTGVGLGAAAFSMQDILLEPYGGEVLALSVSQTTLLTAIFALGTIAGFGLAARWLTKDAEPHRLAGFGAVVGVAAFSIVILADPLQSGVLFRIGVALIGLGGGLFSVSMLTALMDVVEKDHNGIALGAWGAVQATCTGVAVAAGGAIRDVVNVLSANGALGPAMTGPATGYGVVYHLEILLLFASLVVIGPLARHSRTTAPKEKRDEFELAAFPQ